jgi:hypothetical protein
VVRGGTPVRLSRLEYDLLLFFVRHPTACSPATSFSPMSGAGRRPPVRLVDA